MNASKTYSNAVNILSGKKKTMHHLCLVCGGVLKWKVNGQLTRLKTKTFSVFEKAALEIADREDNATIYASHILAARWLANHYP